MRLAIFAFHGQGELTVELVVDIRRERQLALTQTQARSARPRLTYQRKPGALIVDRILRMIFIEPVENERYGRIEGICRSTRRGGIGCGHRDTWRIGLRGFHLLKFALRRLCGSQGISRLLLQGLGVRLKRMNTFGERRDLGFGGRLGGLGSGKQDQGKGERKWNGAHGDSVTCESMIRVGSDH